MKNKTWTVLIAFSLITLSNCSQQDNTTEGTKKEVKIKKIETANQEPHGYGGWYCPDNLNGFPAVNIADWKNVPVVNGRMATKEETQNGTSLINVNMEKYPNAKPLDMTMPMLASFSNYDTKREEIIIIIQALNIDNDSIVGFRYLNGGNGSARLNEVKILSPQEIEKIEKAKFVTYNLTIGATQEEIWKVMTKPENAKTLQITFDKEGKLKSDWRKSTNFNYYYAIPGILKASFAGNLYGCYYVQNDYDTYNYTEKFLLIENSETHITELKITCGPFGADYETQNEVLAKWAHKVKELSEIAVKHYVVPNK